jgi:hypothetical protein
MRREKAGFTPAFLLADGRQGAGSKAHAFALLSAEK